MRRVVFCWKFPGRFRRPALRVPYRPAKSQASSQTDPPAGTIPKVARNCIPRIQEIPPPPGEYLTRRYPAVPGEAHPTCRSMEVPWRTPTCTRAICPGAGPVSRIWRRSRNRKTNLQRAHYRRSSPRLAEDPTARPLFPGTSRQARHFHGERVWRLPPREIVAQE